MCQGRPHGKLESRNKKVSGVIKRGTGDKVTGGQSDRGQSDRGTKWLGTKGLWDKVTGTKWAGIKWRGTKCKDTVLHNYKYMWQGILNHDWTVKRQNVRSSNLSTALLRPDSCLRHIVHESYVPARWVRNSLPWSNFWLNLIYVTSCSTELTELSGRHQ
jgi:hypothetical protein